MAKDETTTDGPVALICVGRIRGPHGIRGLLRIESYTEQPLEVFGYSPLRLKDGSLIALEFRGQAKGRGPQVCFLAATDRASSRDEAETFGQSDLYVCRSDLPSLKGLANQDQELDEPEDEDVYLVDLIGLEARLETGEVYGKIVATPDYGAGVLLEIECMAGGACGRQRPAGGADLVPFTHQHVPQLDLEAGHVTVRPLEYPADNPTANPHRSRRGP